MRYLPLLIVLFFSSCKNLTEAEKLHETLAGQWIILYPDHELQNGRQKVLYSRMQDSIVGLTGLKLVTLSGSGVFQQADSLETKGKWGMTPDNIVFIEKGGKGFENFAASFTSYEKSMLKLTQFVEAEGEKIKLVWHLKKINGGAAAGLFSNERNQWRKRPVQQESGRQVKQRLSAMLQYYSDYFELVTRESSFFVPTRVILPFKFYQHAMGMKDFEEEGFFANLFFNKPQAEEAHRYLSITLRKLRNDFPKRENYVEEYAAFLEQMAKDIAPGE